MHLQIKMEETSLCCNMVARNMLLGNIGLTYL